MEYMSTKYVIQDIKTGYYLSHLFEDSQAKTFQAKEPKIGHCYFWDLEATAKFIAEEYDAKVVKIEQ